MGRRAVRTSSQDLKKLLLSPTGGRFLRPLDAFDEVYPGIILGDASTALSTCLLKELKVTHVLNAAHGRNDRYYCGFVNTSFANYEQAGIKFMGIPALDTPSFYLRSYFAQAADFMADALRAGGKVLIHCQCGISRSATLIAAFLMLKKKMDVRQALSTIRLQRSIFPNQGFLSQLCDYEYELKRSGSISADDSNDLEFNNTPLKDPAHIQAFHVDHRPMFSFRNYSPQSRPITRSGYPLSSAWYDYATKSRSRARSEDRVARSMYEYARSRSASPPPYRSHRATSLIPDGTNYYLNRPRAVSEVPLTKYVEPRTTFALSNYNSSTLPYERVYYHTRTAPQSFTYTPRVLSRPVTNAYIKSRCLLSEESSSLARTLTPRDATLTSTSPYESYSFTSPYGNRAFSTCTPADIPTFLSSSGIKSVPAKIRFPALYPATYRHSYLTGLKAC